MRSSITGPPLTDGSAGPSLSSWVGVAHDEPRRSRMKLTTYARVWTPDMLYIEGVKRRPGHLLRDVLEENGGSYTVTLVLPEVLMDAIRREVASTGDADLAIVAESGTVSVSL